MLILLTLDQGRHFQWHAVRDDMDILRWYNNELGHAATTFPPTVPIQSEAFAHTRLALFAESAGTIRQTWFDGDLARKGFVSAGFVRFACDAPSDLL